MRPESRTLPGLTRTDRDEGRSSSTSRQSGPRLNSRTLTLGNSARAVSAPSSGFSGSASTSQFTESESYLRAYRRTPFRCARRTSILPAERAGRFSLNITVSARSRVSHTEVSGHGGGQVTLRPQNLASTSG